MAALVFCDGFDKYGPVGNLRIEDVLTGDWSMSAGTYTVVAPLSGIGYALNMTNHAMTGTLAAPLTRVAGSLRFRFPDSLGGGLVQFLKGTDAVCTLSFAPTPSPAITLYTAAATIASGGSVNTNATHVVSWDVTIGASAAYAVYLDGEPLFSGTGNTANSFANIDHFYFGSGVARVLTVDDFVLFDGADPAYDASFITKNVIVETTFPNAETQTQLANDGNVLWATGVAENGVYTTHSGTTVSGLVLIKVTPAVNCTLNSISGLPNDTQSTLKLKGVVYSDVTGNPGSLLASGTEVIGVTTTAAFILPITPLAVTAGVPIWIGLFSDGSPGMYAYDSASELARRYANTYASGAPAGPLGVGTATETFTLWGNCTGAASNFSVGLNPPLNADASKLHGATVGLEDLYGFQPLRSSPSVIYGLAVKGFVSKSDTGPRTVSLHTKSGATDSTGSLPAQSLATSNQWQRSMFDKNPNGSVAWTKITVDAAKSGVSVAT